MLSGRKHSADFRQRHFCDISSSIDAADVVGILPASMVDTGNWVVGQGLALEGLGSDCLTLRMMPPPEQVEL